MQFLGMLIVACIMLDRVCVMRAQPEVTQQKLYAIDGALVNVQQGEL